MTSAAATGFSTTTLRRLGALVLAVLPMLIVMVGTPASTEGFVLKDYVLGYIVVAVVCWGAAVALVWRSLPAPRLDNARERVPATRQPTPVSATRTTGASHADTLKRIQQDRLKTLNEMTPSNRAERRAKERMERRNRKS